MKVLMASTAIDGHFNPLTGIAMRLKHNGIDDVRWYTGSRYAAKLAELGIMHYPFRRAVEHTPQNLNEFYPERARLKGPRAIRFDAEKIFVSNVGNHVEDLKDIHREFSVDVLVVDAAVYVQRLVPAVLGIPVVSVYPVSNTQSDPRVPPPFFGLKPARGLPGRLRDAAARALLERGVLGPAQRRYRSILADYGVTISPTSSLLDEPYLTSAAVLQSGVASFDFPPSVVNPRVHYVGPLLPYQNGEPVPLTFRDKLGRYAKTVLVTQGTVDNKDPAKLIVPTIEALKDTDSLIVISTGNHGTAELRQRFPADNVVIEDFIDFADALKHADVFVTNGGFGGVMLSLANGVPLVCAGINEGKNDVNAHVDYHQVGVNLRTQKPTANKIRRAVEQVVTEPGWTAKARKFQVEISRLDPPATAERLIHKVGDDH